MYVADAFRCGGRCGYRPSPAKPNSLVVEGYASVETPPNVATFSYRVRGEGKSSEAALKELVARTSAINAALKARDGALVIYSEDVMVISVRDTRCDKTDDDDDDERTVLSSGECQIVGYVATQNFIGKTASVRDVGTMVGVATLNGALRSNIGQFTLASDTEAKSRAISAAIADARRKAEVLSQGAGARLGDIPNISLDNAGRFDDSRDLVLKGLARSAPATFVQVDVAPENVETAATVRVTYALLR